jgi:hypothetical protein
MIGLGVACSSKSTGGSGGSILGGSGGAAGSTAGSTSTAGKTSSDSGGTASSTGGSASNAGGSTGDACADAPIVCIDAMTASTCDPVTGMDTTFNCSAESKDLGFTSNGCMKDPQGDHCTIDEFSDQGCVDGTAPWGVCHQLMASDALDIYIACFQNTNGLHDEIVCYNKYYDETAQTLDCVGASAECDALTMP